MRVPFVRPAPGPRDRYVVLVLGFCSLAASIGFGRFAYTVIMPDMRSALDLSYTEMGAIGTVGFSAYILVSPLAGFLAIRLARV